ncbi:hypothetical protein EI74_0742 [Mycoplasma testudineum]|uniref:Uncharacterized protein n=1 Tax=Mycoplasma testudineum TaxID=244584 RepID=A0A4R6IB94_9MOLU|nr:hypothetical protein [Mycoplasma testudineum]OYD26633.1 hypothetical protein CG473_03305 [Mycoplasma testudineum]TDO19470.1 hypothetical protein EI74_0742 [Mycoplasma testudineum]
MTKKAKWWTIGGLAGGLIIVTPIVGIGIAYAQHINNLNKLVTIENFNFIDEQDTLEINNESSAVINKKIKEVYGDINQQMNDSFTQNYFEIKLDVDNWYEQLMSISSYDFENKNLPLINLIKNNFELGNVNYDSATLSIDTFSSLNYLFLKLSLGINKNNDEVFKYIEEVLAPWFENVILSKTSFNTYSKLILQQFAIVFKILKLSNRHNNLIERVTQKYVHYQETLQSISNLSDVKKQFELEFLTPLILQDGNIDLSISLVDEFNNLFDGYDNKKNEMSEEDARESIRKLKLYFSLNNNIIRSKIAKYYYYIQNKFPNFEWNYTTYLISKSVGFNLKLQYTVLDSISKMSIENFKYIEKINLQKYISILTWNFRTNLINKSNLPEWFAKTENILNNYIESSDFLETYNGNDKIQNEIKLISRSTNLNIVKTEFEFWKLLGYDLTFVIFFFSKFDSPIFVKANPYFSREDKGVEAAISFWSVNHSLIYYATGKTNFKIKNGILENWRNEESFNYNYHLVTEKYLSYFPEYIWVSKQLYKDPGFSTQVQIDVFKKFVEAIKVENSLISYEQIFVWVKGLAANKVLWKEHKQYLTEEVFGKITLAPSVDNIVYRDNVIDLNSTYYYQLILKYFE